MTRGLADIFMLRIILLILALIVLIVLQFYESSKKREFCTIEKSNDYYIVRCGDKWAWVWNNPYNLTVFNNVTVNLSYQHLIKKFDTFYLCFDPYETDWEYLQVINQLAAEVLTPLKYQLGKRAFYVCEKSYRGCEIIANCSSLKGFKIEVKKGGEGLIQIKNDYIVIKGTKGSDLFILKVYGLYDELIGHLKDEEPTRG